MIRLTPAKKWVRIWIISKKKKEMAMRSNGYQTRAFLNYTGPIQSKQKIDFCVYAQTKLKSVFRNSLSYALIFTSDYRTQWFKKLWDFD